MARKFFIYIKEVKTWADCFVKDRQKQPGGEKILYPMAKWSVEPWQGGEERQAWAEGHGRQPDGSTIILPPPACRGREHKEKEGGVGGLGPSPCRGRSTGLLRLMNCSL